MLADRQPKPQSAPTRVGANEQGLDDIHLWQNVRKDNELAYSILYKKYTQRLYNYGVHACHDHDLVLDCLQELFTSIWTKRKELTIVNSVNAYLFKSFRHLLIKKMNWSKRFILLTDLTADRSFGISLPIDEIMERDEFEQEWNLKLKRCIRMLTRRQREAVFLKFYNDLTYSDIASIMELQVDSVYNVISKALECLRRGLTQNSSK